MEKFNFDYSLTTTNKRIKAVKAYLNTLKIDDFTTIDNSGLTEQYLESIGNYILYFDTKEQKKNNKSDITPNEFRVLCDNEQGLKTYIDNDKKVKRTKIEYDRSDENNRHIIRQLETLFCIIDNIENYHKLINDSNKINLKQKEMVYADIADCKKGLIISEVKSKSNNARHDKLDDFEVEYNFENVKILLRSMNELEHSDIYSTKHCMYLDLLRAIKKANLTSKQLIAVNDYMNGITTSLINLANLDYAIIKIIKKLS